MGIGIGIFLLALGAILTWAVNFDVAGVEMDVIGIILMVVGAVAVVVRAISMRHVHTVVRDRRTY